MDRYLVPLNPDEKARPIERSPWKRALVELTGKFDPKYRHDVSGFLMQSYSEVGLFGHSYHWDGKRCQTNMLRFFSFDGISPYRINRHCITALEFDTKGIYLASVTKGGCLTVHDFEDLCCQGLKEDETKHLLHTSACRGLLEIDAVRWNLANQAEVACTSRKSTELLIFDIGYVSSDPVQILSKRPRNCSIDPRGLSDIAFSSNNNSRVFASDLHGAIAVWDRRKNSLPCLELASDSNCGLNSIQVIEDNQIIFAACSNGSLYLWDLRGGTSATAFQSNGRASYSPLANVKLASMLEKIGSLKAQSNIVATEIHSIAIDPSCPYQLAFHLDDGWSGVLNIHTFQVTHAHCPPPPWL